MQAENMESVTVGKRIQQARKAQKLTQKELAEELGISAVTLNRYEKGHRSPDADVLGRLIGILKCDSWWILKGDEDISTEREAADAAASSQTSTHNVQDPVLNEILQLLENDLPEAKEHILKILIGRKQMKEGLASLMLTGN